MIGYVYDEDGFVGVISYDNGKYTFRYDSEFLSNPNNSAISLTLPKQQEPFISNSLFSFFANLLAEGNLKKTSI